MNRSLLAAAALTAIVACEEYLGCTDIGCMSELYFNFEVTDQGQWDFEIDLYEGDTLTQTITCSAPLPISLEDSGCDSDDAYLIISGSMLPEEDQSLAGMGLGGDGPERVVVRASLDGVEQLSEEFVPEYTTSAPNGEECGPICTAASVTLAL